LTQSGKAKLFRELHTSEHILVLPNAWDVASAVIFQNAGFPAIGTTSAGVAAVFGYPDGQHISRELMLEMVRRIASAVSIPVTADVEAGYGDPVQTAVAVMEAGAAGMNLEDTTEEDPATLADLAQQVEIIRKIHAHTNLLINARTDVFLAGIGDPATRVDRTVERLNAYREAGAGCLFAPGVRDAETIGKLAHRVHGPLNILAVAGTPPVPELQRLGVARVSIGSGGMRATLGLTQRIAAELLGPGTYTSMTEAAMPYVEVNRMLQRL
jgi:2-methylisocitrate lyase-like PEP mutase family enzyme